MKSPHFRRILATLLTTVLSTNLFAQDADSDTDNDDSATAAAAVEGATENVEISKMEEQSYVFRMSNNKFIKGIPVELPTIDVYILDTKVPIPMDAIMGIRFATTEDGKASIALMNGEVYTGTVDMPEVRLAVEWGEAKIKRGILRSMVKTNDLFWQLKDTPSGSKWFLAPKSGTNYRSSQVQPFKTRIQHVNATTPVFGEPMIDANTLPNAAEFAWIWN